MTFTIIENFPDDLLQELKEIWNQGQWKEVKEANPGKMYHHCLDSKHPIFKEFPKEANTLEYYSNPPHTANGPHLDRGRWSAMNIPIEMDHENSYFLTGKTHLLKTYKIREHLNYQKGHTVDNLKGPTGFFYEEEGKFDYYNLEKPVLFSTKTPHGFANNSDKPRVLLSVTFQYTYEQMLNILPPDWFGDVL